MRSGLSFRFAQFALLVLASLGTLIVLSGCGGGMGSQNPAPMAMRGRVHGGQQPVSGATIQLYAPGATGSEYGSAGAAMLTTPVTTDANGFFSITDDLKPACAANPEVYIVSTGGNPGAGTNNALTLMAALGPCGNLNSSTFILIDEVTTVASVYALAPFMKTGGGVNLGISSTTPTQGLTNAFLTVNNLVNTANGSAPGPSLPPGATAPTAELNTLADILAPCVNSNGLTGECGTLFRDATPPNGGSAPTNTIDAALDIAQNPGNNVSALYALVTPTAPFQPTLSPAPAPNDWTVAINYTGNGLTKPYGLAVDASGNVWVANSGSGSGIGGGADSISEFSSTGAAMQGSPFTGGGLYFPSYLAIDSSGDVWIGNNNNSISELSSTGTARTGSPFTGNGLNGIGDPAGLAIDGSDNIWVPDRADSFISKFANDGSPSLGSPYTGSSLLAGGPAYLAIDSIGNVWIADYSSSGLSEFNNAGAQITSSAFTGGGLNVPNNVAIDHSGNLWLTNQDGSLSKFSSTGTALSGAGYSNGGLGPSSGLGVDGFGNVWTANTASLSELSNNGTLLSGSTGYQVSGMVAPISLALDGSGNVWITGSSSNTLTEVVGAAAPVVTPLATAAKNDAIASLP
jgi:hypothetical protein